MDSLSAQPFSVHAPFRQPAVIIHLTSMVMAFLGCYPFAIIQGVRRRRTSHFITLATGFVFAIVGFVTGWISSVQSSSPNTFLLIVGHLLLLLLLAQALLGLSKTELSKRIPFPAWLAHVPPRMHLFLAWVGLLLAYTYLLVAALSFSESFESYTQAIMPLAMGSGFLAYGTVAITHLLGILQIPKAYTPEYCEALIITLCGVLSLFMPDTPILGTNWRAFNLGLLWFPGGLLSICISVQTWMLVIKERNIVNAIIICLTGKAIIVGFTQDDQYITQVHNTLGYMMIIGAIARVMQIIFRPSMFSYRSSGYGIGDFVEEEDELQRRESIHYHHRSAYERLTGQTSSASTTCNHQSIFLSITMVCGFLASLMAMAAGILFLGGYVGWIRHVRYYIKDPATYVNVSMAATFLWTCYVFVLCTIYKNTQTSDRYDYLRLDSLDCTTISSPTPHTASSMSTTDLLSNSQRYEEQRSPYRTRSLPPKYEKNYYQPQHQQQQQQQQPMRPSQYRAKRRSLLIQSPTFDTHSSSINHNRRLSSIPYAVGDNLPEDIKESHQSWLSNGSATSADCHSACSVTMEEGSGSSGSSGSSRSSRSSSVAKSHKSVVFTEEPTQYFAEDELRRTESGRRKEKIIQQQQLLQGRRMDDERNSHYHAGNDNEQHNVSTYYSSERNSSDSHVC